MSRRRATRSQFDLAGWLKRRGILSEIVVRDARDGRIVEATGGNWLIALSHRFRKWTQRQLRTDLEDDDARAAAHHLEHGARHAG